MRQIDLTNMPTPDLVREFEEIAVQQSYAETRGENRRFQKLFDLLQLVVSELKRRGERDRLTTLFEHPNRWVRLQAAKSARPVAPGEARRVLEQLRDSKLLPEALEAGMALRMVDRGWFVPE